MKNKSGITLYKYTLKSLLMPGIALGVICLAATFINLFQVDVNMSVYRVQYLSRHSLSRFYNGRPIAAAIAPALIAFMYIGPAIFTFLSFRHQNNRSSSDLYDSLPHTKAEGYISRILAVLTWEFGIIILSMALSVLMLTLNSISYDVSYIPKLTLSFIAGSLFITGVAALAMSFTGNAFSNITAALLIAFMPRVLFYIADRIIMQASYAGFIPLNSLGIFLNPVNNIPFAVILDITTIWEYYGTSETLIQIGAAIYTLVIALLYLSAGFVISKYRKSEIAGYGVQTATARHILSALAALPFLAYAFSSLLDSGVFNTAMSSNIQKLTVYSVIGFIAFLGVQFAHNRRFKSVIKSLPIFAVAVIIAAVAVFSARGYALKLHRKVPDLEDIEYIKLDENYALEYRYKPLYSYRNLLTKDIEYKNPELINIFQSSLVRMVEAYDDYRIGGSGNLNTQNKIQCEYKLKNGKSITRMVNVHNEDSYRVWELISCNCDYKKLSRQLPEATNTDSTEIHLNYPLNPETCNRIYSMFREEFYSLPSETKSKILNSNNYSLINRLNLDNTGYYDNTRLLTVSVKGRLNNYGYVSSFVISQLVPDTAKYCIERINAPYKDTFFENIEFLKDEKNKDRLAQINFEIMNLTTHSDYPVDHIWFTYNNYEVGNAAFTKEEFLSIAGLLNENSFSGVSFEGIVMRIDVRMDYGQYGSNYTIYAQITPEQALKMEQLYEEKIMTN